MVYCLMEIEPPSRSRTCPYGLIPLAPHPITRRPEQQPSAMPAAAFLSAGAAPALPPPSRTLSRRLVVSRAAAAAASASASSSSGWQGACADSFPPHVTRTRPCHAVSPAAAACVLGDETRRVGAGGGIVSLDDAGAPCSPLSACL